MLHHNSVSLRRLAALLVFAALAIILFRSFATSHNQDRPDINSVDAYEPLLPVLPTSDKKRPDPVRWLQENSNNKYAISRSILPHLPAFGSSRRPRAALISLVRNSELLGMMQSMRQLEFRWNRKYQVTILAVPDLSPDRRQYPWIFFNDEPFTEEFKQRTQNSTSAECYYEVVPREHWSLPDWIDENRFMNSLEYLGTIGVGKGWMVSYHHMCRWNSGFFYKHPILKNYDWYWRIEPDVSRFRPLMLPH
jgi:alpha 1,2-mannosyltransferase